jgi:LuxR family maltose regulon positive regulatory protein
MDEKDLVTDIHIPNIELFICVKHYMAAQKYKQALAVLSNSTSRDAHERFLFGELTFSLLTAVARLKTDDRAGAIKDFERAYKLSFDGEFETPFVELGKNQHLLVAEAMKQADCIIPKEWLNTIDRKASVYAKKIHFISDTFRKEKKLEEPIQLSEREQQVLNDLYIGLSREEIAANRYLSINTIKKILQSLYIKLNANNNVDAVRIAIEKKLI